MRPYALFLSLLLSTAAATGGTQAAAQQPTYRQTAISQSTSPQQSALSAPGDERAMLHLRPDWALIAPHLPDPATAGAAQLELAGDVLQARRFPGDALDYYQYALKRGGDTVTLLNRMGVARLEMHQTGPALALFQQCVRMAKNDSQAWNNLAAVYYSEGQFLPAIQEYKRAVKLNRENAVYRANIGMAYFAIDDVASARKQFEIAVRLDPHVLDDEGEGGTTLMTLPPHDYARLCFQMAKLYARQGDPATAKLWLRKAAEDGLDLQAALREDAEMRVWLKDSDIRTLAVHDAKLRPREGAGTAPTQGPNTVSVPD